MLLILTFLFQNETDKGQINAMYNYGLMLSEGWGVSVDETEACRYFKMAASCACFLLSEGFELRLSLLQKFPEIVHWEQTFRTTETRFEEMNNLTFFFQLSWQNGRQISTCETFRESVSFYALDCPYKPGPSLHFPVYFLS